MYNLIIRPLLFCIDPEKVHRMLLSWLKFYRYLFPVRACVRGYSRVSDPFSYGHLQFKNRIGLSAGFDKNAEAFDELADFGFGFLEVGTVTPDSQSGNPSPRIFRLVDDEVSFDAYIRDTKDMLMAGKTLPGVYGASSPRMNVADLRTKGWEASVTWGDSFTLASKPFNYRIMAGIGDNTSKVTKYDNPNRTLTDPYEGQQLGEIWGYVVDGYFKTDEEARNYKVDQSFVNQMINASALDNGLHAGDLKFVDLDGNNKIEQTTSANDRKDMKVIGNSLPRYNYNFGISADWYGIDFSVLFQGIGKQNWYPGAETSMFWGPYSRPYASFIPSDFMSQVWSEENTNAYFPRPRGYVALGSNRELAVVNTKYLQNLAYCRLKNLSIGYTLPDKWLSKIGFEKIRVYFSGENLLTFTKLHSDYIDPEQASASNSWKTSKSDANIYPWAKTYSFGVDITF